MSATSSPPKPQRLRRLVHDDDAAGLLHARDDGVDVERPQRAQIDDLALDALLRPPGSAASSAS